MELNLFVFKYIVHSQTAKKSQNAFTFTDASGEYALNGICSGCSEEKLKFAFHNTVPFGCSSVIDVLFGL